MLYANEQMRKEILSLITACTNICDKGVQWLVKVLNLSIKEKEMVWWGFLGSVANPGKAVCFQKCNSFPNFSRVLTLMYGTGCFPQSHSQTHNTMSTFKPGTEHRTCWKLGLSCSWWTLDLVSCWPGFLLLSVSDFIPFPHLISYKNSGLDGD